MWKTVEAKNYYRQATSLPDFDSLDVRRTPNTSAAWVNSHICSFSCEEGKTFTRPHRAGTIRALVLPSFGNPTCKHVVSLLFSLGSGERCDSAFTGRCGFPRPETRIDFVCSIISLRRLKIELVRAAAPALQAEYFTPKTSTKLARAELLCHSYASLP